MGSFDHGCVVTIVAIFLRPKPLLAMKKRTPSVSSSFYRNSTGMMESMEFEAVVTAEGEEEEEEGQLVARRPRAMRCGSVTRLASVALVVVASQVLIAASVLHLVMPGPHPPIVDSSNSMVPSNNDNHVHVQSGLVSRALVLFGVSRRDTARTARRTI